jgi:tetratricopeptide (TPR) repeat protein
MTMLELQSEERRHRYDVLTTHDLRDVPARALSAAEPAGEAGSATGHFDLIADDHAEGWVWYPEQPGRRALVEIVHGERVVATGTADLPRGDLADAGIGDGRHRFKIKLPLSLRDGLTRTLFARVAGGTAQLHSGPHAYQAEPPTLQLMDLLSAEETCAAAQQLENMLYGTAGLSGLVMQAHQLIETEFADEALTLLKKGASEFGDSAVLACKIAECHLVGGSDGDAELAYRHALRIDPDFAPAYLGLGNCCARRNAWIEADDAYQAGLAHAPEQPALLKRAHAVQRHAQRMRATDALRNGERDRAAALLKQQLRATPDDEELAAMLGKILYEDTYAGDAAALPRFQADFLSEQLLLESIVDDAETYLNPDPQ